MPWWTAVASLTPTAAWDAKRVSAAQMLDGVGTNHLTATATIKTTDFLYWGVLGNSNLMTFTSAINVPTSGVIAGLWTIKRRNVLLSADTYHYLLHQNESNFNWYAYNGNNNYALYGSYGSHLTTVAVFAAVVNSGTTSRMFINGDWYGNAIAISYVPPQLTVIGYQSNGSEYNLDADEYLHGLGVWTGTPTFQDLRALEAAVRAEMAGIPAAYRGLLPLSGRAGNPPPQFFPGGASPLVPVGRVRGAWNYVAAGRGIITGTVKEKAAPINVPLRRRVMLLDQRRNIIVAETWSDASTGAYTFPNLDPTIPYTVLAFDYTGSYRAVVADNLLPEVAS